MHTSVAKLTLLFQKNVEWVLRQPLALRLFALYLIITKQNLPRDVLEILVNRAEMIAHMNPSGLDAKTCLVTSLFVYQECWF